MAPKKISELPYSCISGLSQILDSATDPKYNWRAVAEKFSIYNAIDISGFERKSLQLDGSPSRSLLTDLAMTGSNVDELFTIIYKVQNADAFLFLKNSGFVSSSLVKSLKLPAKSLSCSNIKNVPSQIPCHDSRSIMKIIDPSSRIPVPATSNNNVENLSLSIVGQHKENLTDDILVSLRNKGLIEFSYEEVCSATHNFSDSKVTGSCKLGMGSFGTVFKGDLKNTTFAIKKLNLNSDMQARSIGLSQFAVEVMTLSKYRHPHLLELVGYSLDPRAPCLIYFYLEKGSLAHVLGSEESSNISWRRRIQITEDIAKGLVYLHTASEKPLIHRDLKSANVLLTNDYQAKIGDFGLARLGSDHGNSIVQTNRLQGTMGYISPEAARGKISTKTDIYSYGVLMLELITNLSAFDPNRGYQNQSLVGLVEHKLSCDPNKLDIISPKGVEWPIPAAKRFLDTSMTCFMDHDLRPTASSILQDITDMIKEFSSYQNFPNLINPGSLSLELPREICENRKTIIVICSNGQQSSVFREKIGKVLGSESKASSLRVLRDMELHFVTLHDAIVIVCHPLTSFLDCLQDSINRFNPHLVISSGLCHGVRGKVSLGDLIVSEEASIGNVRYSVSPDIHDLTRQILKSDKDGDALWKLPGLLPRAPNFPASQVLLWISKLIMEVKLDNPDESGWLNDIEYDHSVGYDSPGLMENMKLFSTKYACLGSANMNLIFDRITNSLDINLKTAVQTLPAQEISLKRRKFQPRVHVGMMTASDIPYQPGLAFNRYELCPEKMLGCDVETLQLYSMCSKSGTPCVSVKGVNGFSDPYEDSRFDEVTVHVTALGVTQFIADFISK